MTTTGSKFMARAEAYHPDSVTSFGLYVGAEEGKQALSPIHRYLIIKIKHRTCQLKEARLVFLRPATVRQQWTFLKTKTALLTTASQQLMEGRSTLLSVRV